MIATAFPLTTVDPPEPPCPNANTGIATAAATTPINAAPAYIRRRLRRNSTSSVFSGAELARQPVDHQLVEPLRLVEILQPPLTEIEDRHAGRQVLLGELLRRRGEQHLAAVPGRPDPRRAMHADPDVALAAAPRLTGVQCPSAP